MHLLKWLERLLIGLVSVVVLQAMIMVSMTFYGFAAAIIQQLTR